MMLNKQESQFLIPVLQALRYLRSFFNLEVSIFSLVYIEVASCFAACLVFLAVNVLMLFGIGMPLMCSFVFFATYPPQTLGFITTAEVAIIRRV